MPGKNILRILIRTRIHKKDPNSEIILYGSHARGSANPDSDWDLLILVNDLKISRKKEMEYREKVFDVEIDIGEVISTIVLSKTEWETKYRVTPFYKNVKEQGIVL